MTKRFGFLHIISTLIFSAALACTVDLASAFFAAQIPFVVFVLVFVISTVAIIALKISTRWLWLFYFVIIVASACVLGAVLFAFNNNAGYKAEDNGKDLLYGGKKVLVLVPHEDDEVLAAGGIVEEYVKYGSQVYLSFYTNGDNVIPGETRIREALSVAEAMGVGEENVIFLGYGDNMGDGLHIYNMPEDELVYKNDRSITYALAEHPPYNKSQYKRENIVADIKAMLLDVRADIIICSEFEEHPDHAALSLFFDEAMEQILKSDGNDYMPVVLKSPAYANYFHGAEDFYADNILSTVPEQGGYSTGIYAWEDRLRLPVNGLGLSRSIYGCDMYKQFKLHKSQEIPLKAEGSVNGDKIFWIRDTHSLSYTADISVSSGNGSFLNNFKLVDNYDVKGSPMVLNGCTWTPDASDSSKSAAVTLAQPSYVQTIRLYDDPDENVNVLNARITFDDGSSIQTGALKESTATDIRVNKDNVKSFTLELLKTEGEGAGLTELEVYSHERDYGFDFIKLTDMKGNFVYDYYAKKIGTEQLKIYAPGVDELIHVESIRTKPNGQVERGMEYNLKNGDTINIRCRKDETLTLIVRSESGKYSDTVVISNPDRFMRQTGPAFEELFRHFFTGNMHRSNCYTLLKTALSMI